MKFRQLAAAVLVASAASALAAAPDADAASTQPLPLTDPVSQPLAGSFHDIVSATGAMPATAIQAEAAAPASAVTDPETCALMLAGVGAGLFMTLRRGGRNA